MQICTNLRSADTPKKLGSYKKRASPLSPGTRECVCLVPKNWDTDACNLRHRLIRFLFCTKTPSKIWNLYKSISMPDSQPLLGGFFCTIWGTILGYNFEDVLRGLEYTPSRRHQKLSTTSVRALSTPPPSHCAIRHPIPLHCVLRPPPLLVSSAAR